MSALLRGSWPIGGRSSGALSAAAGLRPPQELRFSAYDRQEAGSGIATRGKSKAGNAEQTDTCWLHVAREFFEGDRPPG
jgi:hypothetical protein